MRTSFLQTSPNTSPSTSVVPPSSLSQGDIDGMFALMQSYYEHTDYAEFTRDLKQKDDVIVLRAGSFGHLIGFSTLKYFDLPTKSHTRAIGVFSGDTIVHQKYWGSTSLQKAFLVQLCRLKFRHRGARLYWFLISKGYKTYLLMANNFPVHYPRFEQETPPEFQSMMDHVYSELYPDTYEPGADLIHNEGHSYRLKTGVAYPSESLVAGLPRVRYFVEKNPNWHLGSELTCIAEMDYMVLVRYLSKALKKTLKIAPKSSPKSSLQSSPIMRGKSRT